MITLMYVVGNLAKDLGYVKPTDLIAGCDQGGPGYPLFLLSCLPCRP
jgi:hypothetical protein